MKQSSESLTESVEQQASIYTTGQTSRSKRSHSPRQATGRAAGRHRGRRVVHT